MNNCGQCFFAKMVPQDVKKRFCHGVPPTPVALPRGQNIGIQMFRPMVDITDEACALFRPRLIASDVFTASNTIGKTNGT